MRALLDILHKSARSLIENIAHSFREYPRLKSHVAMFSLNSILLYIGDVEDEHRILHKGVSFELPRVSTPVSRAAILTKEGAAQFVNFLNQLSTLDLPCSFVFTRRYEDLEWKVTNHIDKWHGGGGLVGYLHGNWLADQTNPPKVVITMNAVSELQRCIVERYSLRP